MNKRMRDDLLRDTHVDVDAMVAKEGYEYAVGYLEGMLQDVRTRVERYYECQFKRNWQWDGFEEAGDIANEVAKELSLELSTMICVHRQGDNGDDDVGYELVWFNQKRNIADIGIVRKQCQWKVVLETNKGDVVLNCVDDLIEALA